MRNAAIRPMLVLLALVALAPGCEPAGRPIVPDSAVGRRVLEAAMTSWNAGRPPGMLDAKGPEIQLVDSFRKPGQVLRAYRIVSEIADGRTRTFTLELTFEDGTSETVRFLLVGIDPVLVFRDRDYELLTHFEHKMEGDSK